MRFLRFLSIAPNKRRVDFSGASARSPFSAPVSRRPILSVCLPIEATECVISYEPSLQGRACARARTGSLATRVSRSLAIHINDSAPLFASCLKSSSPGRLAARAGAALLMREIGSEPPPPPPPPLPSRPAVFDRELLEAVQRALIGPGRRALALSGDPAASEIPSPLSSSAAGPR